jgi:DNA-binding response OmpR family regulator
VFGPNRISFTARTIVAKILLVEDDNDLANMVRTFLLFEKHTVERISNGTEASDQLRSFEYDVIILDWTLPGMTGIEILKDYRNRGGTTPILMLTGKTSINDKEQGLDNGVDDYLTKPFDMRELGARVRALLRRPAMVSGNLLTTGDLSLDSSTHQVLKNGEPLALVPKEFQLLEFLMRHPNQVFTMTALLNRVWPSDSEATEEALRTTIKRLRKKIDPDGQLLQNVRGVGYCIKT